VRYRSIRAMLATLISVDERIPVGIVVLTRDGYGIASNQEMAQHVLE